MDYQKIRAKIQLPPELQDVFNKGLYTAMKIMFGDRTHDQLMETLKTAKPGPELGKAVGQAAAGTLGHTIAVSKGAIPPELTIPLGVEIVLAIFEFMEKAGMAQPTPQDFGLAMSVMVSSVVGQMGFAKKFGGQQQQPAQAPAPQAGLLAQGAQQ